MPQKILLIPNMPFWSVDKCAKDLIKYNKSDLVIDVMYFNEFIDNWEKISVKYDLIYPMVNKLFYDFLARNIPVNKAITGVLSYTSWDNQKTLPPGNNVKPPKSDIKKLRKAAGVNTICRKLWDLFSPHIPIVHTKYTCDLEKFYPDKFIKNRKLVVGWAGSLTNNGLIRGVHDIIKPVCSRFDEIDLKVQCVEEMWIKDDDIMREFYNSLDLYICASKSEGAPRPVLEAAACGVPTLSVDVGIVPELIENNVNGFIVERTQEAFFNKLKYIIKNKDMLPEMGMKVREKMEKEFNWKNIIHQWTDFFKKAIKLRHWEEK
ncbi:MAG: glycosyltransferase [Spirochaetota bacterium]